MKRTFLNFLILIIVQAKIKLVQGYQLNTPTIFNSVQKMILIRFRSIIHDQSEAVISELVNNFDFIGRLFNRFLRRLTGNPNGLRLQAIADCHNN